MAEKRLLGAFRSFPSLYQMLAEADASTGNHDGRRPGREALWQAETYGTSDVPASQRELDRARDLRRRLAEAVDPCRMVNVLGRGFPTWQLTDPRRPDRLASYTRAEGDGAVLLSLGRLPGVDPFVVEAHHADLVVTPEVVEAIDAILDGISPAPRRPGRDPTPASHPTAAGDVGECTQRLFDRLVNRAANRQRGGPAANDGRLGSDVHKLRDLFVEGLLVRPAARQESARRPGLRREFRIRLLYGNLYEIDHLEGDVAGESETPRVDVIVLGHYAGSAPLPQEAGIDEAISREYWRQRREVDNRPPPVGDLPRSERVLFQMEARGLIRGELGEFFMLPDSRNLRRIILMVGMGAGGRFGEPELVLTARELAWTVARLARRHLAAKLIGTGAGNLPIDQAVKAWLQGLAQVAHEVLSPDGGGEPLPWVTFVECDPDRVLAIDSILLDAIDDAARDDPAVTFRYAPLSESHKSELKSELIIKAKKEAEELALRPLDHKLRSGSCAGSDDRRSECLARLSVDRRGVGRRAAGTAWPLRRRRPLSQPGTFGSPRRSPSGPGVSLLRSATLTARSTAGDSSGASSYRRSSVNTSSTRRPL